jgi:hypothetical protein
MLLSGEVLPEFAILSFLYFFSCVAYVLWEGYLVSFIVWDQWGVTVGIKAIGCRS